jgi:hypothetical protein
LLVAAVIAPPVSADLRGPVSTVLYGEVTINGLAAPAGTPVKAYMEGDLLGTVETGPTPTHPALADNEYAMDVWGTDADIGKTVSFKVNYLGVDYDAPETGTFEYAGDEVDLSIEVPTPDEVWVDDDWEGLGLGDPADGHTFGYDAFATIQDGIDNVGSSTVHVLPGTYDGFEVEETEDLNIIGEEGAVVTGAEYYGEWGCYIMASVMNSQNIDIEGLDFDGSGIEQDIVEGISYGDSTGSITDVTVSDVVGSDMGIGISVWGGEIDTVTISETIVEGCQIGVMVGDDQVNLENCTIQGPADGDFSIGIFAMYGAIVNIESCDISDFWVEDPEPGQAGYGVFVMGDLYLMTELAPKTAALAQQFGATDSDGVTTVEITGCSKITDNNFGIVVYDGEVLANGNNIVGNDIFGIYNDGAVEVDARENWWGDDQGPTHEDNPFFATTTGDAVSDNVDYIPWLDATCPIGNPTPGGPEADFVAEPRTGMAPLQVQFTDQSTSEFDIVSWAWDFGDDTTSAAQNPAHTYIEVGTYTVSLTVTDELGLSDTETKRTYIIVRQELPTGGVSEPANLKATYFLISPEYVMPNQQVKISINIGNDGGTEGTRSVALYINGDLEDSQTVTVSPGSSKRVVFTVTRAKPGTYQVLLEGNEGQFTVLGTAGAGNWAGPLGTGGIIAIVVFVIALVIGLVFVFRRE